MQEAAVSFSKEISIKTNDDISVEVLTLGYYQTKYNKNPLQKKDVADYIQSDEAEMSQVFTTDLGKVNNQMWVLDLPFIFRSHDHAQKVLEGHVGMTLLEGMRKLNIEGLAFAYDNDYRILAGTKKIEKFEDFKGLKISTSVSPVAQETFNLIGANAVNVVANEIEEEVKSQKLQLIESTYPMLYSHGQNKFINVINEPNHTLFVSLIILNANFYKKLPDNYKKIVKNAAISASRIKSKFAKTDFEIAKKCKDDGVEIVTISKVEEDRFKNAVRPVYKKFEKMLSKELIANIIIQ